VAGRRQTAGHHRDWAGTAIPSVRHFSEFQDGFLIRINLRELFCRQVTVAWDWSLAGWKR